MAVVNRKAPMPGIKQRRQDFASCRLCFTKLRSRSCYRSASRNDRAGVVRQDPPEVIEAGDEPGATGVGVDQGQKRTKFGGGVATERMGGARDVGSAFLPQTFIVASTGCKDRIEAGSVGRIYTAGASGSVAVVGRAKDFDARQVGFEGNPAVVLQFTSSVAVPIPSGRPEQRAAKKDWAGVHLTVQRVIRDGTGPGEPIFRTIKVNIRAEAPSDLDAGGIRGVEAANVVLVNSSRIAHAG